MCGAIPTDLTKKWLNVVVDMNFMNNNINECVLYNFIHVLYCKCCFCVTGSKELIS